MNFKSNINLSNKSSKLIEITNTINPKIYIGYGHKDKNGNYIQEYEEEGHSFVTNFHKFISVMMFYWRNLSFKFSGFDDDLIQKDVQWRWDYTTGPESTALCLDYSSADIDYNCISLGTGTTPVKMNDVRLENFIQNGTDLGQLIYGQRNVSNPINIQPNYYSWLITRDFTNHSGEDIEVSELGLISSIYYRYLYLWNTINTPPSPGMGFLLARDILSTTFTIPNNETKTVSYQIRLTPDELGNWYWIYKFFYNIVYLMRTNDTNEEDKFKLTDLRLVRGIVPSTDSNSIIKDESGMAGAIPHGKGTGELVYYSNEHLREWDWYDSSGSRGGDISDNCSVDNTGNWSINNCSMSFNTNEYEVTLNTDNAYIMTDASNLIISNSYNSDLISYASSSNTNPIYTKLEIRNNENTSTIYNSNLFLLKTGSTNAITSSLAWEATETNNKLKINFLSGSSGDIVKIKDIKTQANDQMGSVYRLLHNESGGDITVRKIYLRAEESYNPIGGKLLDTPVTVSNDEVLYIKFNFKMKVG